MAQPHLFCKKNLTNPFTIRLEFRTFELVRFVYRGRKDYVEKSLSHKDFYVTPPQMHTTLFELPPHVLFKTPKPMSQKRVY